jgi:hypothetical protein
MFEVDLEKWGGLTCPTSRTTAERTEAHIVYAAVCETDYFTPVQSLRSGIRLSITTLEHHHTDVGVVELTRDS